MRTRRKGATAGIMRTIETPSLPSSSPGEERCTRRHVLLRARPAAATDAAVHRVHAPLAEGMLAAVASALCSLEAGDRGAFARLVPLLLSCTASA